MRRIEVATGKRLNAIAPGDILMHEFMEPMSKEVLGLAARGDSARVFHVKDFRAAHLLQYKTAEYGSTLFSRSLSTQIVLAETDVRAGRSAAERQASAGPDIAVAADAPVSVRTDRAPS